MSLDLALKHLRKRKNKSSRTAHNLLYQIFIKSEVLIEEAQSLRLSNHVYNLYDKFNLKKQTNTGILDVFLS